MADNDDNATPFAAGTLSLDYVNSLFRNYAGPGADYAVTSQMRWAFNPASELRQAPDAASQDTVAKADTASLAQGDLAKDRGGSTREPSKASLKASPKGQQPVELSEREKSCLGWTALGKSSWEIGQILSISENTVVFHIKNAMRKLGVSNRTVAAVKAMQLGLIEG
jgi:DNA-binding CsgD family transcriptional regulator